MNNDEIILYWSADDNAFVAEVPELPGCMADGKTRQEAVENAERIRVRFAVPELLELNHAAAPVTLTFLPQWQERIAL